MITPPDDSHSVASALPPARSWPFLRTPISIFLLVMLPINGLQAFLILANNPRWIKITAGCVILWTFLALAQGYLRRLIVDRRRVRLRGLFRTIEIPWPDVSNMGVYIPGGGLGATEYLFVTTRSEPPMGKWDLDEHTLQVQDRPGLLDAMRAYQSEQLRD